MAMGDREPTSCPNCQRALDGEYCAGCGQRRFDPRLTLRELLRDVLQALDYDSKILLTVRTLLLRPGQLTADYLAGKRARYVTPAKVYLTSSLIFFAAFFAVGNYRPYVQGERGVIPLPGGVITLSKGTELPGVDDRVRARQVAAAEARGWLPRRLARWLAEKRFAIDTHSGTFAHRIQAAELRHRSYQAYAPFVVLALVPLFAGLTRLFFRRSQPLYLPHLTLALHVHAFLLLVLALLVVLNMWTRQDPLAILAGEVPRAPLVPVKQPLILLGALYVMVAFRVVFQRPWKVVLATGAVILVCYRLVVGASLEALSVATALLG